MRRCSTLLGLLALAVCFAACGNESGLQPCDIRERACQDDIYLAVQRARGSAWDPSLDRTPMRVITAKAYAAELEESQRLAQQRAQEDLGFDYQTAAFELLYLLDPDREPAAAVEAKVSNVAAYYSYATRSVTIIDHGTEGEGDLSGPTSILAHELVHAAQDREIGLFGFLSEDTRDANYALRSIIEGEAVLYSNVVMLGIEGAPGLSEIDWLGYYDRMLSGAKARVFDDASPEFQLYGMLYPLGTRLLTERYLRGGNAAVRDMWAHVPAHTLALITSAERSGAALLPCMPPRAPEGYEPVFSDSLGALTFFGLATRLTDDVDQAWSLASAWRGDRLFVFGKEEALALLWQLTIDETKRADFVQRARDFYGNGAVTVDGDVVLLRLQKAPERLSFAGEDACRTVP